MLLNFKKLFRHYHYYIVFAFLCLISLSAFTQQVSKLTIIGQPGQCDTPFTARMIMQLDSTTLANATQINWDFNDGSTYIQPISDINDTISHTYTTFGNFTVLATVIKNIGTITSGTTIIVGSPDIPVVSLNPVISCNGIVTFTENSTDNGILSDNTRDIYWDFGDGNDTSYTRSRGTNPSITHTYPTGTDSTYNVRMRITNQCGSGTTTATVRIINFNPAIQYLLPACKGADVQFSNTYNPPGVNFDYSWNFGDGDPNSTEASPTHRFRSVGTFNVGLEIRATNGDPSCYKSISKPVIILDAPNTNFNLIYNQECDSFSVSFNNGTTGATSYHWNFGNSDTSDSVSPLPVEYFSGNYSISLTATNDSGCNITQTKTVTVYATPKAGFSLVSICQGATASFTDTSKLIFGTIDNRTWNFGDGATSALQNPTHIYNVSGPLNISLKVNSGGCSDSVVKAVTIDPKPAVSISPKNISSCPNLPVNFSNTSAGAGTYNYKWYFGDGDSSSTVTTTHVYKNNRTNDTSYVAVMNVTNAFGCASSDTSNIRIFVGTKASFTSDAKSLPTCGPDTVNFISTSIGPPGTSLSWDFGDGNTGKGTTEQHIYTNTNPYFRYIRVSLVAISPGGCSDTTDEQFITINPKPVANFRVDTIKLYPPARFIFITDPEASNIYTWDINGRRFTTNNYRFPSPPGTFNTSGSYTVTYIAQNEFGCLDSTSKIIVIPQIPVPLVSFTIDALSGCPPLLIHFHDTSVGTDTTANSWNFGDGYTATGTSVQHIFYQEGNNTVTFNTNDLGGNALPTIDTIIVVYRMPSASFSVAPLHPSIPDEVIYCIPTLPDTAAGEETYFWNFGDGDTSNLARPTHLYANPGSYQVSLTVTTNQGCTNSHTLEDSVVAVQGGTVESPNAFMPMMNGSGGNQVTDDETKNNVFAPLAKGVQDYKLEIFNRWGEKLFTSNSKDIGWDGYYLGKLCKQDVYVWKVSGKYSNGKDFIKTGTVTLFHSK